MRALLRCSVLSIAAAKTGKIQRIVFISAFGVNHNEQAPLRLWSISSWTPVCRSQALDQSLTGKEFDLTGLAALDHAEVAKIISEASRPLGRLSLFDRTADA